MVINMEKPEVVLTAVLVVKKGTKVVVNGQTIEGAPGQTAGSAASPPGPLAEPATAKTS